LPTLLIWANRCGWQACLKGREEAAVDDEDEGEGDLHVEPRQHLLHSSRAHPAHTHNKTRLKVRKGFSPVAEFRDEFRWKLPKKGLFSLGEKEIFRVVFTNALSLKSANLRSLI